ncbi:phosphodiesterase [Mycolicibacterium sp. 050158]|uniref:phosphodiesterase n=1 Tax=Mycolicibacterium sp. 050158 TaxID=3090602 RepID=UPI00299D94FF|nr:phosphodiesterase [Mycolicibacterium sp. 050158]MDX1889253.1 phosphodiesterase [Mycolicibacterium sp. 050158]
MLIAHLSDPHVRPHGVLYQGVVDSNARLAEAVARVWAMDPRPDLVLLGGDLVDHGQPAEYAALREILAALPIPMLVIPGNHDDRENLRAAFADHAYLPRSGPLHYCVDEHPVRVVALDSTVPGHHHGHLDEASLEWLAATLARDPDKPTLLMLHHHPIPCGIEYLDEYRYFDGDALRQVVEGVDNVEIVLCGHVHRSMLTRWAGTVLSSCPSTATEIDLDLTADAQPSSHGGPRGFMLHRFDAGQGLVSHTIQLGDFGQAHPFA